MKVFNGPYITTLFVLAVLNFSATLAHAYVQIPSPPPSSPSQLGNQGASLNSLYDESINFSPGFSVYQQDKKLADLFAPNGDSNLCVPTSIANAIAYQALWRNPYFGSLQLTQMPVTGDYTQQVRTFAQLCGTNPVTGTLMLQAAQCIRSFYQQSGYGEGWAYLLGPAVSEDLPSKKFWGGSHELNLADIRYYLSQHVGLIMDVAWATYNSSTQTWTPAKGGHAFWVTGYDYQTAWGETQIVLKVVNPNVDYSAAGVDNRFDPVMMIRDETKPGVSYLPGSLFSLDGAGFRGSAQTAFVKSVIAFLPDASVSPNPPAR